MTGRRWTSCGGRKWRRWSRDQGDLRAGDGEGDDLCPPQEDPYYWEGYQRGLRRAYYGEVFGTEEEHNLWLSLADDEVDESRRERGRGYRDGLAV